MEQVPLFHEDFRQALSYCASALGGPQEVGVQLWPTKTRVQAGQLLANCLNPERPEKLGLEEVEWILAEAAKIGVHAGMAFLCQSAGYADPQPVTPRDEAAELQKQFIEMVKIQEQLTRRLAALSTPAVRGVG